MKWVYAFSPIAMNIDYHACTYNIGPLYFYLTTTNYHSILSMGGWVYMTVMILR
jgi:hypothetical protein